MSGGGDVVCIGTRGSALALWQANHVAEKIRRLPDSPPVELVRIKTEGDRRIDIPLSAMEGRAFFTNEIETALLDGRVDLAVHSLKDLATEMPAGLVLGAVLEREDARDVLLSRHGQPFESLPAGARIGTSSVRRRALLARWRPDVDLMNLRGNVPTRIEKLAAGDFDAIVLAAAGVKRLGLETQVSAYLPPERVIPAVAQGAIAVQVRSEDEAGRALVRPLDHPATHRAVVAERSLLRRLEGGCQVPIGALASVAGDELEISAVICSLDGRWSVEGRREDRAALAEEAGRSLAEELLARGGEEILTAVRIEAEQRA
ncbi:MAG: hydroxymethylbilane synthase [Thermoanaerobaculia bacterium]